MSGDLTVGHVAPVGIGFMEYSQRQVQSNEDPIVIGRIRVSREAEEPGFVIESIIQRPLRTRPTFKPKKMGSPASRNRR